MVFGKKNQQLKKMKKNKNSYPLIPMKDIDPEARKIAVIWHENATNFIGDKHKLASDIMNYARRKNKKNKKNKKPWQK